MSLIVLFCASIEGLALANRSLMEYKILEIRGRYILSILENAETPLYARFDIFDIIDDLKIASCRADGRRRFRISVGFDGM